MEWRSIYLEGGIRYLRFWSRLVAWWLPSQVIKDRHSVEVKFGWSNSLVISRLAILHGETLLLWTLRDEIDINSNIILNMLENLTQMLVQGAHVAGNSNPLVHSSASF